MTLADPFIVSNVATRLPLAFDGTTALVAPNEWAFVPPASGREKTLVVFVAQGLASPQTACVFSTYQASGGADQFGRQVIADLSGEIEWFLASNVSAVLAQTASQPDLPRKVLLKYSQGARSLESELARVYVAEDPFVPFFERLAALADPRKLQSEPGEIPTQNAMNKATAVLEAARAESLLPRKLLRGAHGGVFLYFADGDRYAEVECDSEGDILMILSDGTSNQAPWLSATERLSADLAKVRAFLF